MSIRLADQQDIPVIAALRMQLLREVADAIPPELPEKITAYLEQHLRDGTASALLRKFTGAPPPKPCSACMMPCPTRQMSADGMPGCFPCIPFRNFADTVSWSICSPSC